MAIHPQTFQWKPTSQATSFHSLLPFHWKPFEKALTLPTNRQTMRSLKATEARESAWHSLLELRISNIKQEMSGWFEPTMRLFVRNFASVSLFVCYALSLPESRKASKSTLFAVQTQRQRPLHTCLFFPSACVTDISRQPRVARFFSQCGLEPRPLFFISIWSLTHKATKKRLLYRLIQSLFRLYSYWFFNQSWYT